MRATEQLLVEGGYDKVTIERIAARSGVSKATIYRWWPNRHAVVLDSVTARAVPPIKPDANYGVEESFLHLLMSTGRLLKGAHGRAVGALIGAMQTDQELSDAYRDRFSAPRRVAAREMLTNASKRGELIGVDDPDFLIDMVFGPLYYRFLVHRGRVDEAFVARVIDYVFASHRPAKTKAVRRRSTAS